MIGAAAELYGERHLRRGPSNSDHEDYDFVHAFRCKTLPPEIASWFNKMRPGNWPPTELFEAARQCPCFLVPDGHRDSLTKHLEWRITPNLIERMLMFSLNVVQRQCLVVLKMLKKQEFVKYINHDRCKFTTFNCKTALLFTLERTPPCVWEETRLLECIVRILHVIREFLFQGECPHYLVDNVDLFDGKLCRECQLNLERAIRRMVQDYIRAVPSAD